MSDKKKKQRVIHTRVSETMEEELKSQAAALGLSVSNMVRNVLQNTLGLVEGIVADGAQVARSARGDSTTATGAPAPTAVVAWQPAVLNCNAVCSNCNDLLPRGTDAAIALTDPPAPAGTPTRALCAQCLEELRHG